MLAASEAMCTLVVVARPTLVRLEVPVATLGFLGRLVKAQTPDGAEHVLAGRVHANHLRQLLAFALVLQVLVEVHRGLGLVDLFQHLQVLFDLVLLLPLFQLERQRRLLGLFNGHVRVRLQKRVRVGERLLQRLVYRVVVLRVRLSLRVRVQILFAGCPRPYIVSFGMKLGRASFHVVE